jgi:hypothetical protein
VGANFLPSHLFKQLPSETVDMVTEFLAKIFPKLLTFVPGKEAKAGFTRTAPNGPFLASVKKDRNIPICPSVKTYIFAIRAKLSLTK